MTPLFVVWVSLCMSVIDFCFVTDHRENNHYFLPPSHSFFWRFQSTFARVLILLKNAAFWRKFSNHQSGPWPHLTFFKSTSIRPQLLTLDLIAASRTMKFFFRKENHKNVSFEFSHLRSPDFNVCFCHELCSQNETFCEYFSNDVFRKQLSGTL